MAVKAVPEGTHTITRAPGRERRRRRRWRFIRMHSVPRSEASTRLRTEESCMRNCKIGDSQTDFWRTNSWLGSWAPKTLGGSPVVFNLYSDDVDKMFDQAVRAGAIVTMPLANQFWGDRYGQITDPFGHRWALGQHVEDVSPEEMERRAREAFVPTKTEAQK